MAALEVVGRGLEIADRQVAVGQPAAKLVIRGLCGGERFPQGLGRAKCLDRLAERADFLGDLAHAEVGIGQLAAELGIVAALVHETLVVRERVIEQLLPEPPDIDGILLLEQRVFTDARQVIIHGMLSRDEIGLGLLANLGFPAPCAVHDNDADRRGQGDPDQRGDGRKGPGSVLTEPAPEPLEPLLGVRLDRLVGQPVLDVVGQGPGRAVAILGLERHRLQADGFQSLGDRGVELPRLRELALFHGGRARR